MSCAGRRDAVFLLALGSLDASEVDALRAHLDSGCPACLQHLADAENLVEALDEGLEPETPSPAVRERLRRRIELGPEQAADPDAPPAASRVRGSWGRTALASGVAAALAAAATLMLVTPQGSPEVGRDAPPSGGLEDRIAELEGERDDALEEIAEMDEELQSLDANLTTARDQIALLGSAGLIVMDLEGSAAQPGASARVFWEWEDYLCYLRAQGLARPGEGERYVLWLEREAGGLIRAGTIEYEGGGAGTLWVQLPTETGRAVGAVVTLEAGGPKEAPAGPVQLASAAS